jgi:SAM-dependent methyltransferase
LEPGFEEQWRERFEEFALHRDDDAGIAGWTRSGLDARLRRFLGLWQPAPRGRRWLDAGCGAGTYTRALTGQGLDVVGVDYSAPTVAKAVARGIVGASFLISDVRCMPFPAGHFDGVLCFGVTQALDDSEPAIRELKRVLAGDGQMWIDGLNRWCVVHLYERARRRVKGRQRHLRYESPRGVVRLCRQHGFTEIELHWLPVLPRRAQRMQRVLESKTFVWMFRHVPLVGLLASHSFIVRARRGPRSDSTPDVDVRLQP